MRHAYAACRMRLVVCGMRYAAWKNPYIIRYAMRFSVFLTGTSKSKHASLSVCVATFTIGNWIQWFDNHIYGIAFNVPDEIKKRESAAGAWVYNIFKKAGRARSTAGCVEWSLGTADVGTDLLTVSSVVEIHGSPDLWRQFLDFPVQILIRMPHESRHVAIHYFASHTACGSEPKIGCKESRSHDYHICSIFLAA